MVLTDHGEKPIETVTTEDLLWDGESWVQHEGVIYKGIREVITYEGLTATPDHLVWVEGKQKPVRLGIASAYGAHLIQNGVIPELDIPTPTTPYRFPYSLSAFSDLLFCCFGLSCFLLKIFHDRR